ncbi:hypothetical protein LCGC14_2174830 [marine sediment metagenome]|uniref:Uncharacterized protein n=1 Tax=marine sediment metagenome TaxID=412755 RepID=A0A0F9EB81_9ZZZZ
MAEDLNNEQSVATQDLNSAGAVNQQDLNQSVTGTQDEVLADGSKKSEKTVKYEEFEKANQKAKDEEAARILAEQKLAQSVQQTQNLADQMAVSQQTAQPVSIYDQAKIDLGFANEEYPTEAQRSQINSRMFELQNNAINQRARAITDQQFIQSHSDIVEVVGTGIGTQGFRASIELTKILNEKSHLVPSAQTPEGAYQVVMAERELTKLQNASVSAQEHQKRIDDATQPMGGSAAGGGAVGDSNSQQMMTREAVLEIERKLANGEQV